jgi:hypothetical protein
VLSTTGASTNTLNQQRQQTLVRGRGGMCVTHPTFESAARGDEREWGKPMCNDSHRPRSRRHRAENSWRGTCARVARSHGT